MTERIWSPETTARMQALDKKLDAIDRKMLAEAEQEGMSRGRIAFLRDMCTALGYPRFKETR